VWYVYDQSMGSIVTELQAGVFGVSNPGGVTGFWAHLTSSSMRAVFFPGRGIHMPEHELNHTFI
jgi:hypothetical protein